MGADIHIVLGRINLQAIAARPATESNSTALVLFGQGNIEAEDFSFEEVPEEYDLDRNYQLFSWLAEVRGDLRPYYEGRERKEKSYEFLQWLDRKLAERKRKDNSSVGLCTRYSTEGLFDQYYFGDHSFIVYGVKPLQEFNYDEVVQLRNHDNEDDLENPTYYRDPEERTYREMFGEPYFKFLEYCGMAGWHFIIFGFDS